MEYNNISQTNKHETIQLTTFYENKRMKKKCFMKAKKVAWKKETPNDKMKQTKWTVKLSNGAFYFVPLENECRMRNIDEKSLIFQRNDEFICEWQFWTNAIAIFMYETSFSEQPNWTSWSLWVVLLVCLKERQAFCVAVAVVDAAAAAVAVWTTN